MWIMLAWFALLMPSIAYSGNAVNVYAWAEEIPQKVIHQFEKETGIKVNYSTFESADAMLAKLRTNKNSGYDIVEPGSVLAERMQHLGMLERLDKFQLSNFKNLDPFFASLPYDPDGAYNMPFFWGITGIFINTDYYSSDAIQQWSDLYRPQFSNQLMLLDDSREVFSMSLILSGYSVNDRNPEHLKRAYSKIKELMPNVRLFNSDAVNSILIDEDATIGMAWNGDLYRAWRENPKLMFIVPKDGFAVWVDTFAILRNAPHRENAYRFLNFLMRPDVAKEASLSASYSTTNLAAYQLMSDEVKKNPILYPPRNIVQKGQLQLDMGDPASGLIEKYWERLKMGG